MWSQRTRSGVCSIVLAVGSFLSLSAQVFNDAKFTSETVVTLSPFTPVGMAFAPDGRLFIWQKQGTVRIVKDGVLLPASFLDIRARVNRASDRGLIGFAFDPNFASNGYVYVAYTYEPGVANTEATPRTQRLSRFTVDPTNPDVALPDSERVLLGTVSTIGCSGINEDCIPNDMGAHTVDHIAFGPDGMLYFSLGDGASYKFADPNSFRSQDLRSLNGKLLRIRPDGTAPPDNPFYDGTNSNQSKVFAYGFRNPYRFTLKPGTSEPYIGEVGWQRFEELDRGRGSNFGWPCWEGDEAQPEYTAAFPERCSAVPSTSVTRAFYSYPQGGGISVGPFYQGNKYPAIYKDTLFWADYNGDFMKRAVFDSTGNFLRMEDFASGLGGPTHIIEGPDGYVYYTKFTEGKIMRITYSGTTNTDPVAQASATPTTGYSPLTVQFSAAGSSDADGDSLTYAWTFGDGTTSAEADPSHTYVSSTPTTFQATLVVSDGNGGSAIRSLTITVGSTAPTATITAPTDGATYKPGTTVNFSGGANDPDEGQLSAAALHWDVLLHHREHVHTVTDATGAGGSFLVENHDSGGEYYYEVVLTARDSTGLESRRSVRVNVDQTAECTPPTTASVRICLPANGAMVASPARLLASATVPAGRRVVGFRLYLDGIKALFAEGPLLDGMVAMSNGTHRMVAKAWDDLGATYQATVTVSVGSGGTPTCARPSSGVNICTPTTGASVTSPVRIEALAGAVRPITGMVVYVDSIKSFSTASNTVDASLNMAAGNRRILVRAWDSSSANYSSEVIVNVGGLNPVPCTAPAAGVLICTPTPGSTVGSPVRISAVANSSRPITGMRVYIDSVSRFLTQTNSVDSSFSLAVGSHSIVVKAWDTGGASFRQDMVIQVK